MARRGRKNVVDESGFYKSFFEKLKAVYGIFTQKEIAEVVGVAESTVNSWLNDAVVPNKVLMREAFRKLKVLENKVKV
jgi:DNA-binding XRE family transcriptional regulator